MTHLNLRRLAVAGLILGLAGIDGAVVLAQDSAPPPATPDSAREMAVEGISKILQALDLFVKSVPQYAPPEVLENGDIILRRIHPMPDPTRPKSPAPDESHT